MKEPAYGQVRVRKLRTVRLFSMLAVLFLAWPTQSARAQTSCPVSTQWIPGVGDYSLLRQDDDYSYLRDPACRNDFWDPLKFVPLDSNHDRYLTIGGEIREWYEGFHNADWGAGPQDGNGYLLQRVSLYSDWHVGDRLRFFGQVTSAIEVGRDGGPRPFIDEARLWLEEAFVDINALKSDDTSLTLRLGRQEFEFGSGGLVDVREGPNVRQAFDGVDVIIEAASWHVDSFATRPVINYSNVFDDPPNHATMFWGVYGVRPLPITNGGNIDVYYLGIDNKQATFQRGTAREVRHTLGTRFWGARGALDYNAIAVLQVGTFGNANIRAWGVAADTGYNLRSVRFKPELKVKLSLFSGDRNPNSGSLGTYNPLFPSGAYFGEGVVNLNGPSNLIRLGPSVRLHLADNLLLVGDYDVFWRKSLQDGVYGLGVNLLRSGLVNQNRYIGSQPSLGVYWQADRHFSLSAAYTPFIVGSFLTHSAPPGRDVSYAAIWAGYKF